MRTVIHTTVLYFLNKQFVANSNGVYLNLTSQKINSLSEFLNVHTHTNTHTKEPQEELSATVEWSMSLHEDVYRLLICVYDKPDLMKGIIKITAHTHSAHTQTK